MRVVFSGDPLFPGQYVRYDIDLQQTISNDYAVQLESDNNKL